VSCHYWTDDDFFLQQHHAAWLGETDNGNLKALLLPYPADQMRMWEISPRVNSPKNDDPSLWEPLYGVPAASLRKFALAYCTQDQPLEFRLPSSSAASQ
jgi:hypothetical protein